MDAGVGRWLEGQVKKVKGLRNANWPLQNSRGDVKVPHREYGQ